MRKTLSILFLLLTIIVSAQDVTREEAIAAAQNHMANLFPDGLRDISMVETRLVAEGNSMFIINLIPEGWILVSGDKGIDPIIGFGFMDHFIFPEENIYNPAYNWLRSYEEQIDELKRNPASKVSPKWDTAQQSKLKSATADNLYVEPFIPVKWNQGRNWNMFCPEDAEGPGGHVYVGCVAVSMAQAMSVFMQPERGEGSKDFLNDRYGLLSVDYENTTYKWDSMSLDKADIYNALLLYHCAVAVDMDFGPDGSGALTVRAKTAMKTYYRISQRVIYRSRFSDNENWLDLLKDELSNGRPIIYKGDADNGEAGHAFNIDGVLNNFFHLNWGWSGSQNGYYKLDALTPGTNNFTQNQAAIVGIQPYYYPTDVLLSNYMVPEDVPAGAAVGEIIIEDEAVDNVYDIVLESDSTYIDMQWVRDYYIDGDSLRTGKTFIDGEITLDTILIKVNDQYDNYLESELILLFADTASNSTEIVSLERLNSFVVYPNPSDGIINFQNNSDIPVSSIKVFSLSGHLIRRLAEGDINGGINISRNPPGMYILEMNFSDGVVIRKRIIKR